MPSSRALAAPLAVLLGALVAGLVGVDACAQQVPDSSFDVRVARPAHTTTHPRLLLDEAHHNFHTAGGRYMTFANLARNDGFDVAPNTQPFTAVSLGGARVLVISNALGDEDMGAEAASSAAFTGPECDAVRDWVRGGGALLLIADHAPMGAAAKTLAARFGVDLRNGYLADTIRAEDQDNPTTLLFTMANGGLADHPITRGRDSTERVRVVRTFTGESIAGPKGTAALLLLSGAAEDVMVELGQFRGDEPDSLRRNAAGRAQGIAFEFGRGRVVVLGEAAMLSAQLAGPRRVQMGMNKPGSDNRQFALNTLRWLTRVLN